MKILLVSNHYPPRVRGGYELGCFQVAEALCRRGHDCRVLCGGPPEPGEAGAGEGPGKVRVRRLLGVVRPLPGRPLLRKWRLLFLEWYNRFAVRRCLREEEPQVIYIWNPMDTSASVLRELFRSGKPVVCYFFDLWFELNRLDLNLALLPAASDGPFRRVARRFKRIGAAALGIRPLAELPPLHGQFCSRMVRERFRSVGGLLSAEVIHFGLELERYPFQPGRRIGETVRILYAGRLSEDKGIDRCLRAVRCLLDRGVRPEFVAVGCQDDGERARWSGFAGELGIGEVVSLREFLPRDEMAKMYSGFDFLIFSSVWEEPYGLVPLEAMASGAVVIATGAGGSIDNCIDGCNSLLYDRNDPADCAAKILSLISDPERYGRIRAAARRFVESHRSFSDTVSSIERSLERSLERS